MAVTEDSSSTLLLPARPVYMKNKRSSQAMRTGVAMPTYTIQEDPPWMTGRVSHAPAATSTYSDDYDEVLPDQDAPAMPSLANKASFHPSYHAHPEQHIMDSGPQRRPSRLPLFKQVRSMLHKPPPIITPDNARWDEYSGKLSETGKPPQVKPSAYTPPSESPFTLRKRSPERRNKDNGDASPVSLLRDDEVKPPAPLRIGRNNPRVASPVSPVSPISPLDFGAPSSVSANQRAQPAQPLATPSIRQIKRKPTPMSSSAPENVAPQRSPSVSSDWTEPPDDDEPERKQSQGSHFSWTTYAPSEAPGRQSIDTQATHNMKQPSGQGRQPQSHFSWSTLNTNATYQARPDSPPPSPPPPIPAKYTMPTPIQRQPAPPTYQPSGRYEQPTPYQPRGLPVQSILSRTRPVQRQEKTEWTPPPRKSSATPTPRSATSTPTSTATGTTASSIHPAFRKESPFTTSNNSTKALPLPPHLAQPSSVLSHLDSLLAQEQDVQLQRKNVQKAITELEKIERASPMDVSWTDVRDAKTKLVEHRRRLEEVVLEEREVGIKIARVRRKEGEEEGLWVRRVTG